MTQKSGVNRSLNKMATTDTDVLQELDALAVEICHKLKEDDVKTMVEWHRRYAERVMLVVERRKVRLELIIAARQGERILEVRDSDGTSQPTGVKDYEAASREALRRATDKTPFKAFLDETMADFKRISAENIQGLFDLSREEDKTVAAQLAALAVDAAASSEQPKRDAILSRRAEWLSKFKDERRASHLEIFKESSGVNKSVLEEVAQLDLDEIDKMALGGHSLEDYCFDD